MKHIVRCQCGFGDADTNDAHTQHVWIMHTASCYPLVYCAQGATEPRGLVRVVAALAQPGAAAAPGTLATLAALSAELRGADIGSAEGLCLRMSLCVYGIRI